MRVRRVLGRALLGDDATSSRSRTIRRILRPARIRLFLLPTAPDGERYGAIRGYSVARTYIDEFITDNNEVIRGKCLEVGDPRYTVALGGDRVTVVDVLDINPANGQATVIGDLQGLHDVRGDTYDCAVVTGVFQYLQDPAAGTRELHRILAPGGTVLLTVPTMGPVDIADADRWRFMPVGIRVLFEAEFGPENVAVQTYGNLLTGIAHWSGLAQEDMPKRAWRLRDPVYPVCIGVRATKAVAGGVPRESCGPLTCDY
jgi:hypothetical protein